MPSDPGARLQTSTRQQRGPTCSPALLRVQVVRHRVGDLRGLQRPAHPVHPLPVLGQVGRRGAHRGRHGGTAGPVRREGRPRRAVSLAAQGSVEVRRHGGFGNGAGRGRGGVPWHWDGVGAGRRRARRWRCSLCPWRRIPGSRDARAVGLRRGFGGWGDDDGRGAAGRGLIFEAGHVQQQGDDDQEQLCDPPPDSHAGGRCVRQSTRAGGASGPVRGHARGQPPEARRRRDAAGMDRSVEVRRGSSP